MTSIHSTPCHTLHPRTNPWPQLDNACGNDGNPNGYTWLLYDCCQRGYACVSSSSSCKAPIETSNISRFTRIFFDRRFVSHACRTTRFLVYELSKGLCHCSKLRFAQAVDSHHHDHSTTLPTCVVGFPTKDCRTKQPSCCCHRLDQETSSLWGKSCECLLRPCTEGI